MGGRIKGLLGSHHLDGAVVMANAQGGTRLAGWPDFRPTLRPRVKVDRPTNFHETYLNGAESKIRRVNFLLRAVGNGHVCGLLEESRQKFINATELDRKSAGKTMGRRLSTNEAGL